MKEEITALRRRANILAADLSLLTATDERGAVQVKVEHALRHLDLTVANLEAIEVFLDKEETGS